MFGMLSEFMGRRVDKPRSGAIHHRGARASRPHFVFPRMALRLSGLRNPIPILTFPLKGKELAFLAASRLRVRQNGGRDARASLFSAFFA